MRYYEVRHDFDLPKRGNLDYYEIRDFDYSLLNDPVELNEIPSYVRLFVKEQDLPLNDFPNNHLSWYVISNRMIAALRPLIKMNIKLFDVSIQMTESAAYIEGYSVMQILKEIDCINWPKSSPSKDSGNIHSFQTLTLNESNIGEHDLFMAIGFVGTAICSQRFVDCVNAHAGTGLYFHEIQTA